MEEADLRTNGPEQSSYRPSYRAYSKIHLADQAELGKTGFWFGSNPRDGATVFITPAGKTLIYQRCGSEQAYFMKIMRWKN